MIKRILMIPIHLTVGITAIMFLGTLTLLTFFKL